MEPLHPGEETYIRPLPSGQSLDEGEVLWLIGKPLKAEIAKYPDLGSLSADLETWNDGIPGFAWRAGSQATFLAYSTRWANVVIGMLYDALSNEPEASNIASQSLYKIYTSLNTVDSAARLLTRGLFFQRTGDSARLNAIRAQAGVSEFFPSTNAFDKALAQLANQL